MDTIPATPSAPAHECRRFAAAILGSVSTKFHQPLESLKMLEETFEPIEGKPGEYTVLVLATNFLMYGVHLQCDESGEVASVSCEEIRDPRRTSLPPSGMGSRPKRSTACLKASP